jgi:hypothetical protein
MPATKKLRVGEVFVAGGLPAVTYNPRAQLGLEERVKDYLDERHRVLSVSGPTKTGKTVLVKKVMEGTDSIWLTGGDIKSMDDLWSAVADDLEINTTLETSHQSSDNSSKTVSGELQVPTIGKLGGSSQAGDSQSSTDRAGRTRSTRLAARKALRDAGLPLIIDDFHYISQDLQGEIVRSVKDLVFDGVPVIVIAVPHRAYDVMRVEKEMTGRIEQLAVGFWSNDELRDIPSIGFEALNLIDEERAITERFAAESFASPYLMQDFCLQVVKDSGVRERQDRPTLIPQPMWRDFFERRASSASKTAFDRLVRGPRQRTDRKPRRLNNGLIVDIYGAVLMAIGHTGPVEDISYERLRTAMKEIAGDDAPSGQEITRILGEMTKIARNEIEGEPVVDYDSTLNELHISDPYFSFFLRWRAAKELAERSETSDHELSEPVALPAAGVRIKPEMTDGRPALPNDYSNQNAQTGRVPFDRNRKFKRPWTPGRRRRG